MSQGLSHVYVMPEHVPVIEGIQTRATRDPYYNAHRALVEQYYVDLPAVVQQKHDFLVRAERAELRRIREWADRFIAAYSNGDPLPTMKLGRTVAVDTSTGKGSEDLKSMPRALYAVISSGYRGTTSMEARRHGEKGGGISGSLTKLHKAGVIRCLELKR